MCHPVISAVVQCNGAATRRLMGERRDQVWGNSRDGMGKCETVPVSKALVLNEVVRLIEASRPAGGAVL